MKMEILGEINDITFLKGIDEPKKIKIRSVGKNGKIIHKIELFINKNGIIILQQVIQMECPNCKEEMFEFSKYIDKGYRKHFLCRNDKCVFFGIQRTEIIKE